MCTSPCPGGACLGWAGGGKEHKLHLVDMYKVGVRAGTGTGTPDWKKVIAGEILILNWGIEGSQVYHKIFEHW